eukprot:gene47425-biopygen17514
MSHCSTSDCYSERHAKSFSLHTAKFDANVCPICSAFGDAECYSISKSFACSFGCSFSCAECNSFGDAFNSPKCDSVLFTFEASIR